MALSLNGGTYIPPALVKVIGINYYDLLDFL